MTLFLNRFGVPGHSVSEQMVGNRMHQVQISNPDYLQAIRDLIVSK